MNVSVDLTRTESSPDLIPRALAEIMPGSRVRVSRMVFDLVRSRCWDWGLSEGDIISCQAVKADGVRVLMADGSVTRIAVEYARFIEVLPADEG